jgi:hypothetical protein
MPEEPASRVRARPAAPVRPAPRRRARASGRSTVRRRSSSSRRGMGEGTASAFASGTRKRPPRRTSAIPPRRATTGSASTRSAVRPRHRRSCSTRPLPRVHPGGARATVVRAIGTPITHRRGSPRSASFQEPMPLPACACWGATFLLDSNGVNGPSLLKATRSFNGADGAPAENPPSRTHAVEGLDAASGDVVRLDPTTLTGTFRQDPLRRSLGIKHMRGPRGATARSADAAPTRARAA